MDFGARRFPTLTPRISELYGASGDASRVGEADAYVQDLDDLEREERALESMVQELVNRPAAVPIGVKFHREGAGNVQQQAVAAEAESFTSSDAPLPAPEMPFLRSSSEEEEDDMEEDDEVMEEDEEEEEEEETTGRATIVRGEGQPRGEDSFARSMESGDDSMDMEELPPPGDWH